MERLPVRGEGGWIEVVEEYFGIHGIGGGHEVETAPRRQDDPGPLALRGRREEAHREGYCPTPGEQHPGRLVFGRDPAFEASQHLGRRGQQSSGQRPGSDG